MCCLAFFRFLRVGEFTIPTESSYSPSHHLSLQDISVDSRTNPCLLQLLLKQSKTDPFRHGAKVYIGAMDTTICPIRAVLAYLAKRSSRPGPKGFNYACLKAHTGFPYLGERTASFLWLSGRQLTGRMHLHTKSLPGPSIENLLN